MAQTGLTFAQDPYDRERYQELEQLGASMLAEEPERIRLAADLFALERGYATPKLTYALRSFRMADCCWYASVKTADGRCREVGRT